MSHVLCCMMIWWSSYEDMMMMTRCRDHILTENIWFVWSTISYSGYVTDAGRTTEQGKIELLSQWTVGSWVSQFHQLSFYGWTKCRLRSGFTGQNAYFGRCGKALRKAHRSPKSLFSGPKTPCPPISSSSRLSSMQLCNVYIYPFS